MKNGFVSQDVEFHDAHNHLNAPQQTNSSGYHQNGGQVPIGGGGVQNKFDQQATTTAMMINGGGFNDNDGLHARKSSFAGTMDKPSFGSSSSLLSGSGGGAKFSNRDGAKDAYSTYDVWWCRTKGWINSLKHVPWKNSRALPGRAYSPTEIEHVANVITHGLWIIPAIFAGLQLVWRSDNITQRWVALVYGSALTLLFAVSTIFHCVHYCDRNGHMKDLFHRCDRAMIYVFIAGSYYPWLSLSPPAHPTILFVTNWMVWLLAGSGIIYQQVYHERYKCLETFLYCVMGIGPSLVLILNGHHFKGMEEVQIGGVLYIVGICFFKADGKIPFAHAIWHLFVVVGAFIHYYAILKYLY